MPQPSRRPVLVRSASAAVPAAVLLLLLAVLAAAGPAAVDLRRAQAAAAVGPDAGSTPGPGRRAVVPATGPGAAPAAPPPPSAAPAALAPAPVSAALDAACDAVRFAELPCVHGHGPEAVHAAGGRHGASAPAVAVRCDGDGREGNRLQVVYVRAEGRPDRRPEVAERLRRVVAVANGVVTRSSDGRRALRVVHDASCAVDLPRLTVPRERLGAFAELAAAARQAGLSRVDRKYLLLVDDDRGCALAEQYHDDRPGTENRNNDGDMVAALWLPCWDGVLAAHEVVHLLGGVQPSAPRSTGRWSHCTDGHDVMCYPDGSGQRVTARCAASSATLLDCGRDDYFSVAPPAGSYLSRAWNTASSSFLVGGGAPVPTAPSAPRAVGSAVSGETAVVRWEPPVQARSGVTAYEVLDLGTGSVVATAGGGGRQAEVALAPWREYRLAVRARNAVGTSPSAGDERVLVGRAPDAPRGLGALPALEGGTVGTQVSWLAVPHAEAYVVHRDGRAVARTTSTSWHDPAPAAAGRTVEYAVTALNAWGTSPAATTATVSLAVTPVALRLASLTRM